LTFLGTETAYFVEAVIIVLIGLGLGTGMPIMNLIVQNEFEQRDLGVATASSQLFRGLGSTIGVAVFGTMLSVGLSSGFNNINKVEYFNKIIDQPEVLQVVFEQGNTDAFVKLNSFEVKEKILENYKLKLDDSRLSSVEKTEILDNFSKLQTAFSTAVNEVFVDSLKPLFSMSAIFMFLATLIGFSLKEKKLSDSVSAPGVEG